MISCIAWMARVWPMACPAPHRGLVATAQHDMSLPPPPGLESRAERADGGIVGLLERAKERLMRIVRWIGEADQARNTAIRGRDGIAPLDRDASDRERRGERFQRCGIADFPSGISEIVARPRVKPDSRRIVIHARVDRAVGAILPAVVDGDKGFPEAITSARAARPLSKLMPTDAAKRPSERLKTQSIAPSPQWHQLRLEWREEGHQV